MKKKINKRKISFAEAINESLFQSMNKNKNLLLMGLGITDPKAVFGTTKGLLKKFGKSRVIETPTSENAITGIAIGSAINNNPVVLTHQRVEFALLSMDQIINQAAKWHFMTAKKKSVPIVIRLVIGRGWGQGPTHSQNLQAWFAHIPGLKVVCPTTPNDARDLLYEAIFDPDPVVFLEHRWLHNSIGTVKSNITSNQIGKARTVNVGKDVTVVASSYMVIEALRAIKELEKNNINAELIDLRSYKPIDWKTISRSLKKTGRLLVVDSGFSTCSIASEIIAKMATEHFHDLKTAPIKLAMPDVPEPTGYSLTKNFHISKTNIVIKVLEMLKIKSDIKNIKQNLELKNKFHDQPDFGLIEPF